MKATSCEILSVSTEFVEMFSTAKKVCEKPMVYKSWDISGSKGAAERGKEGVPYHMLEFRAEKRNEHA